MRTLAICAFLLVAASRAFAAGPAYDPLAGSGSDKPPTLDLVVHDEARDRDIPVLVYLPADVKATAPVVLFSHGLGGSRQGCAYLGTHWAQRGYVGVFPQHAGSDEAIWKNKSPVEALAAMREAVSVQNLVLRLADVHAVLDQLARWNGAADHPLHGRLDLAHVGMSGHSFGAATTTGVSGESYPLSGTRFTDSRIKAALAMSPSPAYDGDNARAFAGVRIPWMIMTGTEDDAPFGLGGTTAASRLEVYAALPPGGKYELVLDKARHGAFFDHALPGERESQNPNHHRAVVALSTTFWDAYLRDDPAAKRWLDGDGPRTVLEAGDSWETK